MKDKGSIWVRSIKRSFTLAGSLLYFLGMSTAAISIGVVWAVLSTVAKFTGLGYGTFLGRIIAFPANAVWGVKIIDSNTVLEKFINFALMPWMYFTGILMLCIFIVLLGEILLKHFIGVLTGSKKARPEKKTPMVRIE